jgi:hypothetical protein
MDVAEALISDIEYEPCALTPDEVDAVARGTASFQMSGYLNGQARQLDKFAIVYVQPTAEDNYAFVTTSCCGTVEGDMRGTHVMLLGHILNRIGVGGDFKKMRNEVFERENVNRLIVGWPEIRGTKAGGRTDDLYFIQAEHGGPIKIGRAACIETRMETLQVGSPYRLVCIGHISYGGSEEAALHRRFHALRLHGEWFEPSKKLLSYIRKHASLLDL